ncbi:penicillin-binding transpeptidase domain-containing protein [Brevibacillus centrosporus]|uniref:peptidoglycan D,D-transpeptidase FtsI family protein n=1 Tax=Brevibacillus centrosporus TaxID=54910 RepID=UPI000F0A3F11|nr:penicillin-binding transpeptidase domain-containing protein [Brevibacillus centrosporus]MEC2131128.1 penicillin-binding transpeptidase domain-containing protein [Brevibacillus centrosporus]RNB72977.1 penicillin-binding protein [Brevibacillus centrosporus]GED31796.1 penicillin-binding protein [Brevibacillus centrosporus]
MEETKEPKSHIPIRLNILFLIVFLFFAAIILRLAFVQLVEGEQYRHELEKFSIRELPISAPRGRILDKNGAVLVSNKPVYTVQYVEEQGQDIDEEKVADRLAKILIPDGGKLGTDKELLKKTIELRSTLPVAFDEKKTNELKALITPKLQLVPKQEQVDSMSDYNLVKTALYVGLRVRSPFDDKERENVINKLKTSMKNGNATALDGLSDLELLKTAFHANVQFSLTLDKEDRDDLIKEVKAQIRQLPTPAQLSDKSDMDLLRYASLFELDVPLPLTDQQRQFQWHKLSLLQEMRSPQMASYIPRRVKVNITQQEMFQIEERRTELPGISVELEPVRQIMPDPDGTAFGTHFLGYINAIRPESLKEYEAQGYNAIDRVGVTGLEAYYERYLRGKDGIMDVHVNKNSETVEKTMRQAPEPGNDLVLALDWRFQSKVEAILKEEVEAYKKKPTTPKEFKDAHVMAMNPNTGEILAMASYPDYNLNLYYDRKEFNKVYSSLILPNESNRFIYTPYPPASTYKPLSVMIALQEGLTTPNETIYDRGGLEVGTSYKRNWKAGGHGPVNARRALQVSNNTYMYEMAIRLAKKGTQGWEKQFSVLDFYNAQFGLGVKTGIDLPGEKTGWENPNLYYGNLADAMIGQYDLFTPIQIAQYISTIANGGYRIRPHLVKEIRRGTTDPKKPGQTLTLIEPQVLNRVNIDPKYIQVVKEGMHLVTQPGGTVSRAFTGLPYNVAAKSGTAQTGRRAENALVVGFAPYENPQIVFVVVAPNSLKDGTSSSDATGPISRRLLEAYDELNPGVLHPASPTSSSTTKP